MKQILLCLCLTMKKMIMQITLRPMGLMFMVIFFFSCSGEKNHIPSDVIAKDKMADLNCFTTESAMRMVAGTARSMGLTVDGAAPWEK